jgi:hypothetical protein
LAITRAASVETIAGSPAAKKSDSRSVLRYDRPWIGRRSSSIWRRRAGMCRWASGTSRVSANSLPDSNAWGSDSWEAWKLLQQFEDLQRLYIHDRDRLERELAKIRN